MLSSASDTTREDLQQQRDWWSTINLLPDTGNLDDLSSGTLWSAISRRGKSLLHIDDTDGVSWQWTGRKLWVFVNRDEAAAQGIHESPLDAMRDETPGQHRFINWQQCPSFQWVIVNEGDTLLLPGDQLHWRRGRSRILHLLPHRWNARWSQGRSRDYTIEEAP